MSRDFELGRVSVQFANAFAIAITFARWRRRSEATAVTYGTNFYFSNKFVGHEPILIIFFGKNVVRKICDMQTEPYILVIVSSNVLQLRTSLNVAVAAANTWC